MPRPAGTPNKNKDFLMNRLKDMYGDDFDAVMSMAKNCLTLQRIADQHAEGLTTTGKDEESQSATIITASSTAKLANESWDRMAQYTHPKLKAIEVDHSSSDGSMSPGGFNDFYDEQEEEEDTLPDPK